jgi:hypothetical protein
VQGVGGLLQPEPREPAPLGIGEEGEAGAEPGAEGGLHLRRIDVQHDDARIGDLKLVLKTAELTQIALLLRAPPAARGEQGQRVAAGELGQPPVPPGVVGQVEVGEAVARIQRSGALAKFTENARHQITTVE